VHRFLPDERIKIISYHQKQGIGKSRREAVKLAQGEVIGILDSDDALEEGALDIMIQAHQNNHHALIYSQLLICDSNLNPVKPGSNGPIPQGSDNLCSNLISHFATFKKSAYLKTAGYNPRLNLAEDKDIFYKLEEVGKTLFIDQVLYRYRIHQDAVSSYNWQKRFKAHIYHLIVRSQTILRRGRKIMPTVLTSRKLINLTKRVLDKLYFPFLISGAKQKLTQLEKTACTNQDFWQIAHQFSYGLPLRGLNLNIRPAQISQEILDLMAAVKNLNPLTILEIGTATGGTLYLWTKIAPVNATIISLDMPEGPFGGGYLSARQKLMESFPKTNQNLHLIKADSHAADTKEKIIKLLAGRKLDFLFIDGDHSYLGVKADWEDYSPLVRAGGLIALHDIVHNSSEPDSQVDKLWEELKKDFNCQTLVSDKNQGWAGIGIIKL